LGFVPPGEETFVEVSARFLVHQNTRLTYQAYERERGIVENNLQKAFVGHISAIRKADIQRYITTRSGQVSPHTVQKELNVLKHLMRLAVEWELIPLNPTIGVKAPRVPPGRIRYLQPSELRAIMQASPTWIKPIIALAVSTGMRRSEILGLRWVDFDRSGERVLLRHTKNGEGRVVYLNQLALSVLASLDGGRDAGDRIFALVNPGKVSVAFGRVCRKLRIPDFRFHDLRHTAASWLRMNGADIHTVAQLLGHKDLRMAARYQHLSPTFLADAVRRLDGVFGDSCYPGVTDERVLNETVLLTA
jgi:integrase